MGKTTVDEDWRITLPSDVRKGLRKGQVLLISKSGDGFILRPSVDIEKFERELKGCVRGSKVAPDKLSDIWGIRQAHD